MFGLQTCTMQKNCERGGTCTWASENNRIVNQITKPQEVGVST
jgi:hypothetical protein